jgi:hypothetical protein
LYGHNSSSEEEEVVAKPAAKKAGRRPAAKKAASRKTAAPKRKREEMDDADDSGSAEDERVLVEANRPSEKRAKTINPNTTTKVELKKILTAMGVKLPVKDSPKSVYVDLYNANVAN